MRKLTLALLALTGCIQGGTKTTPTSDLVAYPDSARGVVCYTIGQGTDRLSCVVVKSQPERP